MLSDQGLEGPAGYSGLFLYFAVGGFGYGADNAALFGGGELVSDRVGCANLGRVWVVV